MFECVDIHVPLCRPCVCKITCGEVVQMEGKVYGGDIYIYIYIYIKKQKIPKKIVHSPRGGGGFSVGLEGEKKFKIFLESMILHRRIRQI